jgi:hypothetical protein
MPVLECVLLANRDGLRLSTTNLNWASPAGSERAAEADFPRDLLAVLRQDSPT